MIALQSSFTMGIHNEIFHGPTRLLKSLISKTITAHKQFNMIRDGSYPSKFADFLRTQSQGNEIGINLKQTRVVHGNEQFPCSELCQKEPTPSDVGKLNWFVIPKKYAFLAFVKVWKTMAVAVGWMSLS
jgi:hypothetical protein